MKVIEIPITKYRYSDFLCNGKEPYEVACDGGMLDAYHDVSKNHHPLPKGVDEMDALKTGQWARPLKKPFYLCIAAGHIPNTHHCGRDHYEERYMLYEVALQHLGVLRFRKPDEYDEDGDCLILDDFSAWVEFPCPDEEMPTSYFQVYEDDVLVHEGDQHDLDNHI